MGRTRTEHGAVTAEAAVTLPVLILVAAALAWMVALGASQARVVDAARETARALARGDAEQDSVALGRRIAPSGSRFRIHIEGRTVTVIVTADVRGPGGIFGFVHGHEARAEAVAALEAEE